MVTTHDEQMVALQQIGHEFREAAESAGTAMREFGKAFMSSPILSLDDVRNALVETIRAEVQANDVTWQHQLPESSRIMLNGATRMAERLGVVVEYDSIRA